MKNSYSKLFNICEAGESFVEDYYSGQYNEDRIFILGFLMNLEAILDAGRRFTSVNNETDENDRAIVNKRMDNLRGEIRKMIDTSDKKVVQDFVQGRAKALEIWLI